ncbi:MAG: hypothetical protein VKK59_05990 [Vampirovibrionales bacterium]|nr:hypothetical protein [Vampirovibrionales bacterium]
MAQENSLSGQPPKRKALRPKKVTIKEIFIGGKPLRPKKVTINEIFIGGKPFSPLQSEKKLSAKTLEKFSSQADPAILQEVKKLAKTEGKQLQSLMNEAFQDLLEKRRQSKPRKNVMALLEASMTEYQGVYEHLAQ